VIGDRVGPYVITAQLGEGGMGVVYRAMHTLLNRPAAIKVLRPELAGQSTVLDRFLNEARVTTAIRHPGIVEVYDYGHTEGGAAYIAMELLEGSTLGQRLAERGRLSLHEALTIARRIAAPLAAAHEAGVVHRDLKPDNVFLIRDPEGGAHDQVKLLDFGIAKIESATNRTTLGVVLGTPAYMAPEQCRGLACDHRVDLYALGCILYELLGGEPPFGRAGTVTDLMAAHLTAPVPRLPLAFADHEIGRLISRLLAKSPDLRPRNAGEVVFEIDRHLAAVAPPPPGPRTTLRLAIATATGLALTLTSIGAWYRWRRSPRIDDELGAPPPVVGSIVRAPVVDAGATQPPLPPTVEISRSVEMAKTVVHDASPAHSPPPISHPHDAAPSEVTVDLGSAAATADVNTTVSP
jgi:serine/threonine protein kinase